jgi:CRISPR type I-E-associated protein CasB/Cse2
MARMTGLLNLPGHPLGQALAEAGFNEGRLNRLLKVYDTAGLAVQVRRVSRFLAAAGVAVNWLDFAYFILTADPEKREDRNRRIARDYYYSINQKEKAR